MRKLIVLLDEGQANYLPNVPEEFEVTVLPSDATKAERESAFSQAEVIFGEPKPDELKNCTMLRWVQMFWAGADRYLHDNFPKGVTLTTASGAFGETIAEHALAMLFGLCRHLPGYARAGKGMDLGCEKPIAGRTAMIFGCGDIGSAIAKRLKALGVHTIGVCRNAKKPRDGFDALTTLNCAEAFLPEADFVLCALPSSPETRNYLDGERLSTLRDDAVLINVGRGDFIDTNALTKHLEQGKLFGVGLDVVSPEPLPETHPLWAMSNVILTPHVAGVSFGHLKETEQKILAICEENLQRYIDNLPLKNEVIL